MISAFFIFNQKGELLISRLYRPDVKRPIADVFRIQVISSSDVRSPIVTLGYTSFFHVKVNNIYVVAVTKNNANAALVFEFCYRVISICKSYFGKVDEECVKNNFVLIYELIDEINDFGYPQNSEIDTLKSYITTESVVSSQIVAEESSKITTQATGVTSWRRADVKYKKNEAFVDVVETVNLSMSAKGTVLRADVDGHIQMRAYLSGTPECKFGLNDKLVIDKSERGAIDAVELDDCRFHQCVRLNEFDSSRTISFIPPDGEFELMTYRATTNVKLPLRVIPTVNEIGTTQATYHIVVKTNFGNKLSATNVVLRIPTPLNTTSVDCKVQTGKAKYVPEKCGRVEDPTNSGRTRAYFQCDCPIDQYNDSTSVGTASHRCRLPSSYVHFLWVDRTLFESIRKKQLPQYQMGTISNQGQRDISDTVLRALGSPYIPHICTLRQLCPLTTYPLMQHACWAASGGNGAKMTHTIFALRF